MGITTIIGILNTKKPGAAAVPARKSFLMGAVLAALFLAGCAGEAPSALDPRGVAAAEIATLWWISFGLGTAVFLVVTGLLLYIVFVRARGADIPDKDAHPADGRLWIWVGGIIVPLIILVIFLFFNLRSLNALASPATPTTVTIEVVGRQWWWEVRYPDEGITTANEIHIPVGQPVQIRLTSADVIHSFWVPQLHGKIDMNPGQLNSMWLQADEPGVYRGICAEFCGVQHARMQFLVVARPAEDFEAWLERERQPAPAAVDENVRRGQQIFLGSACVYCHTVRGTNATGNLGPDLTHLASRRTIGAGMLENNRGNLAGWIVDPQHIKPGNLMPPTNLHGSELQALLDYLETLQ